MAILFRFRRNFLLKLLTDIVTKGLTFLFVMLVARGLGSQDFGVFSAAQSIAAMGAILCDLGLNMLVTREIAARRGRAPELVGNLFSVKLILSGLVLAILLLLTRTEALADLAGPLILMGGYMVLWSALEFFSSILCGFERMEWETVLKGSGRALVVILGVGALAAGWGVSGIIGGMVLAAGLVVAITVAHTLYHRPDYRLRWDASWLRGAMAQALPLSAVAILVTLYVRVDIVMLEALRGDHEEIGIYAAAVRVVDALGGVAILFSSALFPIFSDLFQSQREAVPALTRYVLRLMAFVAVPMLVGGLVVAAPGIDLVFGEEYRESALALQILLVDVLLLFMNVQLFSVVIAAGKQRPLVAAAGLGLAFNIGINALLIPGYGYRGAAVATVLTEMVLLVVTAVILTRRVVAIRFPLFLWRYLVAGADMGAVLVLLAPQRLYLAVPAALVAYLAALLVGGEIHREDVRQFRRLVGMEGKGT